MKRSSAFAPSMRVILWSLTTACGLTAGAAPLWAADRPSLRITRIQNINDPSDPFVRISVEYELVNDTDRDFCLLFRHDRGDTAAEIRAAAKRVGYAELEIHTPSGEYAPPLTGFPDTAFPDVQQIARYGLLRFQAHSRAANERLISDDEALLDRSPARYRLATEGIWCDVMERYGLKPPFTYFEVNSSLVETITLQDGKPALVELPPEEEVYVVSAPTRPLVVKE